MPEPAFDPGTAHRWFGVELNDATQDALSAGQVTPETCDAHILPSEGPSHGKLRTGAPYSTGTWTQANPSTCSKWPSDDTRSVPVSMAWAAIQMSLVGKGRPFALSAAAIRA